PYWHDGSTARRDDRATSFEHYFVRSLRECGIDFGGGWDLRSYLVLGHPADSRDRNSDGARRRPRRSVEACSRQWHDRRRHRYWHRSHFGGSVDETDGDAVVRR